MATIKPFRKMIKELNLDVSHFTGQLWSKGKKCQLKRPVEDYLSNKQPIGSYRLKNRLLREGFFQSVCSCCNRETWLEKPIPLELDHIDGNTGNNQLSNLRLICPNCHALTSNYKGKNIGNYFSKS